MTQPAPSDSQKPPVTEGHRGPKGSSAYLGRVISLLETLVKRGRPMSLSALARATSLAPSTTHRLLAELTALELTQSTPNGYTVGARARLWAQSFSEPFSRAACHAVFPHLVRLHQSTGLVVTFGALASDQVTVVDVVFGPGQAHLARQRGDALPRVQSAIGQVLIAQHFPPGEEGARQTAPQQPTRGGRLAHSRRLAEGLVSLPHDRARDQTESAIAIRDRSARPVGAIAITWHSAHPEDMWLDELRRAAYAATASLRLGRHELSFPAHGIVPGDSPVSSQG